MDLKDLVTAGGIFIGAAIAALIVGLRTKIDKSVIDLTSRVRGVVVPLELISSNVDILKGDVQVIKNDIASVKDDQKETKTEVRNAVNDRTEILTRLSKIEGIEQGREERDRKRETDWDKKRDGWR